jgi:hypothetical protein
MPSLNTPLCILFLGVVATQVERGFADASDLLCRFSIAFYSETVMLSVIVATRREFIQSSGCAASLRKSLTRK